MADRPLACVIGYETKDGTSWKACILAYTVEDAVKYLYTQVNTIARINTTEGSREIDAFHPQVRKDFLTENVVEEVEVEVEIEVIKEVEVPVEVIKEVIKEVEVPAPIGIVNNNICPWCDKEFKTSKTLKTHCIKFHLDETKD